MVPNAPGGNLATALKSGTAKWTDPAFVHGMNEEKTLAPYLEPNYTGVPWSPCLAVTSPRASTRCWSTVLGPAAGSRPRTRTSRSASSRCRAAATRRTTSRGANNLTFSVLRSSHNQAAAMAWLKFFSSPSTYAQYVNTTGISSSQNGGTFNGYARKAMGPGSARASQTFLSDAVANNAYYDQQRTGPPSNSR